MLELRLGWKTDNYQNFLIDLSDYVLVFARPVDEGDEKAKNLISKLNDLSVVSLKDIPKTLQNKMQEKGVDFHPRY